ncbi:translocation/assembly module TamB domain-containing protein [Psychrobacter pygoscelis]|uniref:translocation/assembly module TamB domain-containing protein n=1 Tax=Psychrobacter pygoscelis TaxID=2488563 RepID=UPI00103E6D56|nr:translocation/assembly module TamB domain-containing protein [Psychrobacter pygoscelis]
MISNPPPSPKDSSEDPAQRDARAVRRWYPLSFLLKLMLIMILLVVIMFAAFYYVAGTESGTRFLLEKASSETGIKFAYGKGNLREGIWIKDIHIPATEDIDVDVDQAYVKIGWRAIFSKEVHLRDANIHRIDIINRKPPTGDPYDYNTLKLPVNLRFDQAQIDSIHYKQVTKEPIIIKGVLAKDLTWVGSDVEVGQAHLQYADIVKVDNLSGGITLSGDYPLDAKAIVTVSALEKVYVDPLNVSVTGSLKRTVGKVSSRYNDSKVEGEFVAQGLDDEAPFQAKLRWDEVQIPYLESQDIHLKSGLLTASGVTSNIRLRINSELTAKDIPSGHYQGRGVIANSQLQIEQLLADVPEGRLALDGVLDWSQAFTADITAHGRGFDLRRAIPKEYEDYKAYAPKTLDGKLDFAFKNKNANSNMQINIDLDQRDGEQLNIDMVRGRRSAKSTQTPPWYIDANWLSLTRRDVPKIGNIISPEGKAHVIVQDGRLSVDANANITELSVAPAGVYDVKMRKNGDTINLPKVVYNGIVGDLSGTGEIQLAGSNRPLTWQINAITNELLPKNYREDLPIERLEGNIIASGRLIDINQVVTSQNRNGHKVSKRVQGQRHDVTIGAADLQVRLDASQDSRDLRVTGKGDGRIDLIAGEVTDFDARFDGRVNTRDVPTGDLSVDAYGSAKHVFLRHLRYGGEAGQMDVSGDIDLRQDIAWNVTGNFDKFDVGYFVPENPAILTGDLTTSGRWITDKRAGATQAKGNHKSTKAPSGKLGNFSLKFDGILDTDKLPAGKLNIDASGDAQVITVKRFRHVGDAGSIDASGTVDVRQGLAWDIKAQMQQFNLGYFAADMPSNITGVVLTNGQWSDTQQNINLNQVNLTGTLKGQQLSAAGSLKAKLKLPKDLTAYFERLKGQDSEAKYQQVNALIERLDADNLVLRWGDNYLTANGNAKQLEAKVNITSLDQLSDNLAGKVSGGATVTQPEGQALPTLYIDLVGERMAFPNLLLREGRIRGKIVDMANSPSQLVVSAQNLEMAGRSFDELNAVFNGTEQDHVLSVSFGTDQGRVSALVKGGFNREDMRWSGVVGKGKITSKYATLNQLQPAQLIAALPVNTKGKSRPAQIQLAAHCWGASDQSGKLCLRNNLIASPDKGQVDLTLQNIDTTLLSPFMPKDLDWQAKINGKAVVGWKKGAAPDINATLYSDNGKLGLIQEGDSRPVTVTYKRISLIAMSVADGLKLRTDINTGQGGKGYAEVIVDPYKSPKPISGALVINELNLAVFKPFFPGIRVLEGNITMAGGIGGTLNKPDFYGNVELSDGRVALLDVPINFTNLNATAKIRGNEALVDGSFNSGSGTGQIDGTINWQQKLQAKLSIEGNRLVLTQPPLLVAEVSPDIDIIVRPTERYVKVEGAISVPSATIRPPEASEDIITQSEDVVVLDRRLIGNLDEVLAVTKPWSINANIGVDLGDDVNFRGFGAVLPLAGAIEVQQSGQGAMQAKGVVQVSRRTNIDAFGQNLELNYAQIRFNGDVRKPNLSIEAVKEIEGKNVGVRVKGDTANPNIIVFNNAGLTQQQAMNALVTGRIRNPSGAQVSEQGFKSEVTNNLAAAGLSFGLSGTRSLTNEIGRAFGLQSLTVDASGNSDDTNVNVTGYITPDLYIRYGVGVFNAQNSLSVRYQLTRRVYVEATSAAENVVDVVYSWQF